MIKSLFILLFGLCVISLYAQDEDPEKKKPESGDVNLDDRDNGFYDSYDEYKKRKNRHWQGLDIGINGLSYGWYRCPSRGISICAIRLWSFLLFWSKSI